MIGGSEIYWVRADFADDEKDERDGGDVDRACCFDDAAFWPWLLPLPLVARAVAPDFAVA